MVQIILRRAEVERSTGLPRSTIYELIARGTFPRPIQISARAVGWLESEVADWQKARVEERDAGQRAGR